MRVHFHLVRGNEVVEDEEGLEVADFAAAHTEALETLKELRRQEPPANADWSGWRLDIADDSGAVLASINLDAIGSDSG